MNIQLYRNFITIAESGNLTAAARKLCIAQPALSNQLKTLEREFGSVLMLRGARRVELTDAGRILYEKAKHICALEDNIKREIFDCTNGMAGSLRLGLTPSSASDLFQGLLLDFQRENPNVKYDLYETSSEEVLELLQAGVIDVAIARTPVHAAEQFELRSMPEEPMLAICRKDSGMLPEAERIPLDALKGLPLYAIRRFVAQLTELCCIAGFTPQFACINTQFSINVSWAEQGLGVAVLPASALARRDNPGLRVCILDDPSLNTRRMVITVRDRYLPSVAQKFLSACESRLDPEA